VQGIRVLRHQLANDPLRFLRYFYPDLEGLRFFIGGHHRLIADAIKKVFRGEITRLIINVPPSYTKTQLAVVTGVAQGLATNPRARFLHLSYSDNLALLNSTAAREIITSPKYQKLWPMAIRADMNSKKLWYTELGGGLYATSAAGQVTGFRAGRMGEGFTGAILIDDPLKPDEAKSPVMLNAVNDRFNNTIQSRLAQEDNPIVVIMQRLHPDDLCGYLLRGGSGEQWHHLLLPANIDHKEPYPAEYDHGVPLDITSLPEGALWPKKHTTQQLMRLKGAAPTTFDSQYDQRPRSIGDILFEYEWWRYYDVRAAPAFEWLGMYADTAQKEKKVHDFSVIQLWGFYEGRIYLIDMVRGRWKAPTLQQKMQMFVDKHYRTHTTYGALRYVMVEDKASGTGLIQALENTLPVPILPIQRSVDKLTRAMDAAPSVAAGKVVLPEGAEYVHDFVTEHSAFRADNTHAHDDQVDVCMDAVQDMLGVGRMAEVFSWN